VGRALRHSEGTKQYSQCRWQYLVITKLAMYLSQHVILGHYSQRDFGVNDSRTAPNSSQRFFVRLISRAAVA
jgi:hypothetical protein